METQVPTRIKLNVSVMESRLKFLDTYSDAVPNTILITLEREVLLRRAVFMDHVIQKKCLKNESEDVMPVATLTHQMQQLRKAWATTEGSPKIISVKSFYHRLKTKNLDPWALKSNLQMRVRLRIV